VESGISAPLVESGISPQLVESGIFAQLVESGNQLSLLPPVRQRADAKSGFRHFGAIRTRS